MLWCTEWRTMSERCTDETGPFRCGRVQTFTRQLREAKTIQVATFRVLAECTRVLTSLPNQRGDSTGATRTPYDDCSAASSSCTAEGPPARPTAHASAELLLLLLQ